VERIERKGVSKVDLEKTAKADLIAQNEILHSENRKLRDRLVNLMIKHGEIP
jgi:regulator of replication initiation timing